MQEISRSLSQSMKCVIIVTVILAMNGCIAKQNTESTIASPSTTPQLAEHSDTVDYLTLGMDLMNTEKFGGIEGGLKASDIICLLGQPEVKSDSTVSEAHGMNSCTWLYPAQGCEISFYQNNDNKWIVYSYFLDENSLLKSTRGIGISSTTDEVQRAYQKEIGPDVSEDQIVAGTMYGGIVFWMTEGRVRGVFVGPSVVGYD